LKLVRLLVLFGIALPALAQYAGPAILSRGEAPTAISAPEVKFRPFVEFTAVYETNLTGVAVTDAQGTLPDLNSSTLSLIWGISGAHSWRHTKIALDYRGGLDDYRQQSRFDSISQALLFALTQQVSRHTSLSIHESAGVFTRAFGQGSLSQTIPYDPAQSFIPTTDFFDNRTTFSDTQVNFNIQKTSRLSFSLAGDYIVTRYRAAGLAGTNGLTASGNTQYRLSRRSTIGADYTFGRFVSQHQFGDAVFHAVSGTFARALSAKTEFSGSVGAAHLEQTSLVSVPIDPAIAALLGISAATEINHFVTWVTSGGLRLSRGFRQGVAYVGISRGINPGNGLFTTSISTDATAGYTYTGLRRWSFGARALYSRAKSVGNIQGDYKTLAAGFSASRSLGHYAHLVFGYDLRQYDSGSFNNYNRVIQAAHFGIGFAPGDVPLRIW